MNLRPLGSSGIEVSEISLGSWLTYSGGVARERSQACVKAAFEAGINFLDTANVYGRGAAETLLGEVLSDYDRSSYVLATKVYFQMSDTDRGLSAEQIHKQIDASLKRLRTDYVDLYQCHRYDDETPLEETMGALTEVVQAGKARHIGFSEWPVERIEASLALRPEHLSYPVGDATSAGPREFRIAAELGFKTAVTTRPGVLFPEHGAHLTALPRISLNGEFQQSRYLRVLLSGAATAMWNGFRRVDAA